MAGALFVSDKTLRRLGLDAVIASVDTLTAYGAAVRDELRAFTEVDVEAARRHFDLVERCHRWLLQEPGQAEWLGTILERIVNIDLELDEDYLAAQAPLAAIKTSLEAVMELQAALRGSLLDVLAPPQLLADLDLLGRLPPARAGFALPDDYTLELRPLRQAMRDTRQAYDEARARHLAVVRRELGLPAHLQDEFVVDRSESELLARLRHSEVAQVLREHPGSVHFRIVEGPELVELAANAHAVWEELRACEQVCYTGLARQVRSRRADIEAALQAVGKLDYLLALARFMQRYDCCLPRFAKGLLLLSQARHLPLEQALAEQGREYTPIDVRVEMPGMVITGSNMGGKTMALFTVASCQILAQLGVPVPAQEMQAPLFSRLFVLAKEEERSRGGLSAFAREIAFLRKTAQHASNALFVLDEPGTSTTTDQGRAIYMAALEFLHAKGAVTVVSTHDERLAAGSGLARYAVAGLRADAPSGARAMREIHGLMDYRVIPAGGAHRPDAIRVAELLGLKGEIIERALQLHAQEERDG